MAGRSLAGREGVTCHFIFWLRKGRVTFIIADGPFRRNKTYLDVLGNTYQVDCASFYGANGDFISTQDGAGPHRARVVTRYLRGNFPAVWGTGVWPTSSPDLNVLGYFAWGHMQHMVEQAKPLRVASPKVAIRNAAREIPIRLC